MNTIRIIGLGTSDIDKMPLGVYKELKAAKQLFVRTMDHPAVEMLTDEGAEITSFDSYYEQNDTFEDTYARITDTLLKAAETADVLYAVPGHPMVYERRQSACLKRPQPGRLTLRLPAGRVLSTMSLPHLKYRSMKTSSCWTERRLIYAILTTISTR